MVAESDECSNWDVFVGPAGSWYTAPFATHGEMSSADPRGPRRRKSKCSSHFPPTWHPAPSAGTPSKGGTTWLLGGGRSVVRVSVVLLLIVLRAHNPPPFATITITSLVPLPLPPLSDQLTRRSRPHRRTQWRVTFCSISVRSAAPRICPCAAAHPGPYHGTDDPSSALAGGSSSQREVCRWQREYRSLCGCGTRFCIVRRPAG